MDLVSNDHAFRTPKIFDAIAAGTFGPLNSNRLFATGIERITSRMAVSYPGKFKALAIAAGSYAPRRILCDVGPVSAQYRCRPSFTVCSIRSCRS